MEAAARLNNCDACGTPELAAVLAAVDLAIFIDPSQSGSIGLVACQRLESGSAIPPLTHGCDIPALPRLARQLYGRAPSAYLLTARGGSFDLPDGQLTPATEAMVQPLAERTLALRAADDHRQTDNGSLTTNDSYDSRAAGR
ncbi:MAG: hypothetical protein FJ295_20885 [Planctomycetes bacterium]|nr:hypothetical protein [Planctomycetota bacterium]